MLRKYWKMALVAMVGVAPIGCFEPDSSGDVTLPDDDDAGDVIVNVDVEDNDVNNDDDDTTPGDDDDTTPGDDDDTTPGDDDDVGDDDTPPVDTDGDGWQNSEDCQPGDPVVYPGAPELCNGQDDDCDGAWDEGCPPEPELEGDDSGECGDSADNDVDGLFDCDDPDCFGSPVCAGDDDSGDDDSGDDDSGDDDSGDDDSGDDDDDVTPPVDTDGDGFDVSTDCDDTDPVVYPGAPEWCNDGIDQDCNSSDLAVDTDGDGYQDMTSCPLNGDDCDDTIATVHPFAIEVCGDGIDQDCYADADDAGQCTSVCTRQLVGTFTPAAPWSMSYGDVVSCTQWVGVSVCGLTATMTDTDVTMALYGLEQAVIGAMPTNQWVQTQGMTPLHTLVYRGTGNVPLMFTTSGSSLSQGTLLVWGTSDPAYTCKGAYAAPW